MIRNQLESSRINVVYYIKHKTYRTAVDLFRPSTTRKTWVAVTSTAMTEKCSEE